MSLGSCPPCPDTYFAQAPRRGWIGRRISASAWPNLAKLGSAAQGGWCPGRAAAVWLYTQRAAVHGEEGKGCTGKLDIHPCSLGGKMTPCPMLSVPPKPSICPGAGGLRCPGHAGGVEEDEQEGGSGSLGKGTGPLSGRRQTGGVLLSRRAEGSEQPSLSGVGCHRHIKQPAELLSALAQRGSILPNRNWGGQGQGDCTSCALLLARITAGVSCAAWLTRPMESLQHPKSRGCKVLTLLELISQQDRTPKHPGSLKRSLGTLRSE